MTKELLQKFISSSCSEQEQEYVYNWISDPKNKEEVSAIMKISWDKSPNEIPEGMPDKQYFIQSVLEKNNDYNLLQNRKKYQPKIQSHEKPGTSQKWFILKVAASLIFAIAIGFSLHQYTKQSTVVDEIVFIEKSNPNGRKSTIVLPDGSKAILNSDSKIRYEKGFNENFREVILEGEAFFEVEKKPSRPFIVSTGDISTTVLGTSFNVRAYAKSDNIQVAVVTGKVEVKKASYYGNETEDVVFLTPSKIATYQREERKITTSSFNMEEVVGWKDGILIFKNADQTEIAKRLKAWYGLAIEFEGGKNIMNKRYTGKFDNNSLEYVLKAISYTSEISYEITDNKVILKRK